VGQRRPLKEYEQRKSRANVTRSSFVFVNRSCGFGNANYVGSDDGALDTVLMINQRRLSLGSLFRREEKVVSLSRFVLADRLRLKRKTDIALRSIRANCSSLKVIKVSGWPRGANEIAFTPYPFAPPRRSPTTTVLYYTTDFHPVHIGPPIQSLHY
jgi:hypothetical protein